MRSRILAAITLCVAAACGSGKSAGDAAIAVPPIDAAPTPDAAPDAVPSCVGDGSPMDPAALQDRLGYLASPELAGRGEGTPGDLAARGHVAARFQCLGLVPAGDDGGYHQPFSRAGHTTGNVIAMLPGSDPQLADEFIVIGAHVDHLGQIGDKLYLGANDNASGVTAMLAVAQLIRQRTPAPRRTLVFVAFGAEESGLNGSAYFVAHPPAAVPLERIVYMLDLDMVGSYTSRKKLQAYGAFPNTVGRARLTALLPFYPGLTVKLGGNSERSDNAPFCAIGIPYVFLFTPDASCYHAPCDTADRIDYADLARIADLAARLALVLADDDTDLVASRAATGCGLP